MHLRRPTALFGRLCKKNFIKCCSEPVLPFAGLQTPAKCKGGVLASKFKKKVGIDAKQALYQLSYIPSGDGDNKNRTHDLPHASYA